MSSRIELDYDNDIYNELASLVLDWRTREHLVTKRKCIFYLKFSNGDEMKLPPKDYDHAPNYERSFFKVMNAFGIDNLTTDSGTFIEKIK